MIAAFQATHRHRCPRRCRGPTCDPASTEIAHYLSDEQRAVLGTVPQLVRPHRPAGTWNPGDHGCVAGELLAAKPADKCWAIRGHIVEISRDVGSR